MIQYWNKNKLNVCVLASFILITFLIRLDTFFHSSYDWDESLYFLGAQSLLNGNLPYLEIWDHKPPMIFVVHALAISLFGESYISIRILSCIFITAGAFGLFLLLKRENDSLSKAGYFAGLLYILSTLLNGGKAANSELFYVPLLIYSFVLANMFVKNKENKEFWSLIFFSGLLLGAATSINYLSALYSIPLAAYLLLSCYKSISFSGARLIHIAKLTLFGAVGSIIIFSAIIFTYIYNNSFDDFIYANFTANTTYIHVENQEFSLRKLVIAFSDQFSGNWLTWILASLAIFLINANERKLSINIITISIAWLFSSTLAILISRLYWSHYFLQFNPGLCILAGILMNKIFVSAYKESKSIGILTVVLLLIGGFYNPIKESLKNAAKNITNTHLHNKPFFDDTPRNIANYISRTTSSTDYIYVVDYNPIIHSLSNTRIPTRFVFPPFIIGKISSKMLPLDSQVEVKNILNKKPIYIIKKHTRPAPAETNDDIYDLIQDELTKKYFLETTINNIELYKLK